MHIVISSLVCFVNEQCCSIPAILMFLLDFFLFEVGKKAKIKQFPCWKVFFFFLFILKDEP